MRLFFYRDFLYTSRHFHINYGALMLELIRQIPVELPGTQPPSNPIFQRKIELFQLFGQVANICSVSTRHFTYSITHNTGGRLGKIEYMGDRDSSSQTLIKLSPLLLIDPREIPQEFRTPDFENEAWCQRFKDWLSEKTGLVPKDCTSGDKNTMQLYFRFCSDPEQGKNALKFLFSSALTSHKKGTPALVGFLLICNILLCVLLLTPLSLLATSVIATACIINIAIAHRVNSNHDHQNDIKALQSISRNPQDLQANANGALFFLRQQAEINSNWRNHVLMNPDSSAFQKLVARFWFHPNGDRRTLFGTSSSSRITNISQYMATSSTRALQPSFAISS